MKQGRTQQPREDERSDQEGLPQHADSLLAYTDQLLNLLEDGDEASESSGGNSAAGHGRHEDKCSVRSSTR